jgi:SEC-C motif-containing protein
MFECPCGSGKQYAACCEPYISGKSQAPGPEELMRARYTAHVKNEIDFIVETHNPKKRTNLDRESTEKWAAEATWLGLDMMRAETNGDEGTVEFVAKFRQDDTDYDHHEISSFVKMDGKWFFDDGYTPSTTVVRDSPKVGRNEPCPCGSGKKYKKCCGRN